MEKTVLLKWKMFRNYCKIKTADSIMLRFVSHLLKCNLKGLFKTLFLYLKLIYLLYVLFLQSII